MKLAFTYNLRHFKLNLDDPHYLAEAEFDEPETISVITKALKKLGHAVYPVEADENAFEKLKALRRKVDLVFNIAEGFSGADREAHIPAILEMLEIPYTGPKPLSYALALHKAKTKEVLFAHGIPTPKWITVFTPSDLNEKAVNFYPAIVKPVAEGSSKGISAKSLVHNSSETLSITTKLLKEYPRGVLIEEYLSGREFTVGILGYLARVLPIVEVTFEHLPKEVPKFDHLEAKWVYDSPAQKIDPLICPANISSELEEEIKKLCLKAFHALEMADWARIDIRLDKNEVPNVIEINCPPGIIPDPKENSRFPRAAQVAGLEYHEMIEEILKSACKRYFLKYN